MLRPVLPLLLTGVLLSGASASIAGQQPAQSQQLPAEADPGVRPFRLIDRDEIRVSRVELQPGAIRRVHVHDDVEYHLWVPVSGTLEITIGQDAPKPATAGAAFFMKKGTPHGFRNVGTTPAAVFEIFVKKSTTTAGGEAPDISALMAAMLPETFSRSHQQHEK
jgi:quercetin dioxygenase-like cupin family protein